MRRLSDRHRRLRDVMLAGGAAAFLLLEITAIGSGWPPAVEIGVLLGMALNFATLCWLVWAMATGRIGVAHWTPARQPRWLERRAAARARAEALTQQQRLEAALSHGPYRPGTAEPPASDGRARARQELLEAVERHGGLSPQARAAAEKAKRYPG
jgi:hypothetical protein